MSDTYFIRVRGDDLPKEKINFSELKNEIGKATGSDPTIIGISYHSGGRQERKIYGNRKVNGQIVHEVIDKSTEYPAELVVMSVIELNSAVVTEAVRKHRPRLSEEETASKEKLEAEKADFLARLIQVWPDFIRTNPDLGHNKTEGSKPGG